MKLHEYQSKNLFAEYGITIPEGKIITGAGEAPEIIDAFGLPVMVKAQVLVGGRGKAGGIKLAKSKEEALETVETLFGKVIKGIEIDKILLVKDGVYERLLYCSLLVDRASRTIVAMVSPEGGVEIEEVAVNTPEKILRQSLDVDTGFTAEQLDECACFLGLEAEPTKSEITELLKNLFRLFIEKDCSLAEINPLFVDENAKLEAGDAKVIIDDNALYRHPEFTAFSDQDIVDPLEIEARQKRLSYVKLDGNIGCIVNGAGLAMATMDVIKFYGGEPANFLDVGGASKSEQVREALRIVTATGKVKVVWVNIFGGIVRCDQVAQGLLEATGELDLSVPIVVRLEGTNSKEAREMLAGSDLIMETSMVEAARKAVAIAEGEAK